MLLDWILTTRNIQFSIKITEMMLTGFECFLFSNSVYCCFDNLMSSPETFMVIILSSFNTLTLEVTHLVLSFILHLALMLLSIGIQWISSQLVAILTSSTTWDQHQKMLFNNTCKVLKLCQFHLFFFLNIHL